MATPHERTGNSKTQVGRLKNLVGLWALIKYFRLHCLLAYKLIISKRGLNKFLRNVDLISLNEETIKRMQFLGIASRLFEILYPYPEKTDSELSYIQGILNPIFDDLIDLEKLNPDQLKLLVLNPNAVKPETKLQKTFIQFWSRLLQTHKTKDNLTNAAQLILQAQIESIRQESENLTWDEALKITQEKGASAMLFWRTAIWRNEISPSERIHFSKLGILLQFINDIFDLRKDLINGISTPIAYENKLDKITTYYDNLVDEVLSKSQKSTYNQTIALLFARGKVALNQFKRIESYKGEYSPNTWERTELVCDMETYNNQVEQFKIWKSYLNLKVTHQ